MPYLELVLKEVLLVGHLAIETQQTLLLRSQRLNKILDVSFDPFFFFFSSVRSGWPTAKTYTDINLVLLMRVHDGRQKSVECFFIFRNRKYAAKDRNTGKPLCVGAWFFKEGDDWKSVGKSKAGGALKTQRARGSALGDEEDPCLIKGQEYRYRQRVGGGGG